MDIINMFAVQKSASVTNIEADLHELILKITPYRPDIIVCDSRGANDYVFRLQQHFGVGIVVDGEIVSRPSSNGMIEPTFRQSNEVFSAKIDKLTENKKSIAELRMNRLGHYSKMDKYMKMYIQHWINVVIKSEDGTEPEEKKQVVVRKGDD